MHLIWGSYHANLQKHYAHDLVSMLEKDIHQRASVCHIVYLRDQFYYACSVDFASCILVVPIVNIDRGTHLIPIHLLEVCSTGYINIDRLGFITHLIALFLYVIKALPLCEHTL